VFHRSFYVGPARLAALRFRGFDRSFLGLGANVVQGEQPAEELFAGGGTDGVAEAVVFGEGFDFVEVMV